MKLLELFSGTGSVGKIFRDQGWDVLSLDLDPKSGADIITDILDWDYKKYPKEFDFIWASPPCTEFSKMKQQFGHTSNIKLANQIVKRTLKIIKYFKPKYWFLENPQTGRLKEQDYMDGLKFTDVDYCQYGRYFRKRTRLWNNTNFKGKLCTFNCPYSDKTKHIYSISMNRKKDTNYPYKYRNPIWDGLPRITTKLMHQIPEPLILDIIDGFM